MSAQELKLTIHSLLGSVNDKEVLDKIIRLLLNRPAETDSDAVVSSIEGEAISSEQYQNSIDDAIKSIDAGEFVTHEDLCKEDWD